MNASLSWQSSPFDAPTPAELDQTLGSLLQDIVSERPDAIAVIDGHRRVSFAELAGLANRLARQIGEAATPDGPVALIQPLNIMAIAAWFACSQAGRPLLLLEPHNPPDRNRELVKIAGAKIVIHGSEGVDIEGTISIVPIDEADPVMSGLGLDADAPLMIFSTSGSTGEPKLVAYSTQTLLAKVLASKLLMGVGHDDRVMIAGSHGNFGFLHHAMVFLLAGGSVCLLDIRKAGLSALFSTIREQQVGHVRFTPSLFRLAAELPEAKVALRELLGVRFSGEPLLWNDVAIAHRLLKPMCQIQNVYGSTESAIFIWTYERSSPIGEGLAPIGRIYPLWEYAIYEDELEVQTPGDLRGRLIARSTYQALGDWKEGVVDRSRFPQDLTHESMRLYDTGDVVQQARNKDLTMLSRSDRLVKVNGFRVSLAEIEAQLSLIPGCSQVATIAISGPRGVSLAAFYTRHPGSPPIDCRAWLEKRLPEPMIPARFHELDEVPLLAGGKVDFKRLEVLIDTELARQTASPVLVAPQSDIARLSSLWIKALDQAHAADDPDQDFFDLGGDSLQFLGLWLSIEREFGRHLDQNIFLDQPTLRRLATLLRIVGVSSLPGAREDGSLAFDSVRKATGSSQGMVLAMPGLFGAARVSNWLISECFDSFDIWTCSMTMQSGTALEHGAWVELSQKIADAIRRGRCPTPSFLFGFSMAGYVAWLVDRMLAVDAKRPHGVICLDAPALHRHRKYAPISSRKTASIDASPARMLLIKRQTLSRLQSAVDANLWVEADAHLTTIGVRTLEHADMDSSQVLAAAAPAIRAFTLRSADDLELQNPPISVQTPSSELFEIIAGSITVSPEEIIIMRQRLSPGRRASSSKVLRYLELAHGELLDNAAANRRLVGNDQTSFSAHYALVARRDAARGKWVAPLT